jgi:hypothetical protein
MNGRNEREAPQIVMVTPELAVSLLEANQNNRPLNHQHVDRIASEITGGRWKFNGDTIKLATNRDIVDGQHRLWAIIEAKQPVESVIIYDIDPDAFSTIDTLRKPRSGADILAIHGVTHHRVVISTALQWLTRWQRKCLENYRAPVNRVENSDVERAFKDNPGIRRAAERASKLRGLTSVGIIAFFYFILTNRNPDLAERMLHTLENPAGVSVNDPFFRLRAYLTQNQHKDPLMTIALMIKAANAAHEGREMRLLKWTNQGNNAEPFPKLSVGHRSSTPR